MRASGWLKRRAAKAVVIEGEDAHKRMEQMMDAGEIDGAVTMHYPFPIGVSTVGRVITPWARQRDVPGNDDRDFFHRPRRGYDQKCRLRHHRSEGLWH